MFKLCIFIYTVIFYFAAAVENDTETYTIADISTLEAVKQNAGELQPPSFKESTKDIAKSPVIADVGEKFQFRCGVRGKPKPDVKFYKENRLLLKSNKVEIVGTLLRISDVQFNDSGKYICNATNSIDTKALPFRVVIKNDSEEKMEDKPPQDPNVPHWTNPKKMKKLLHAEPAGNTVQFRCQADGAKPLQADWFKNGERIAKEERIGGYKFRHRNQMIVLESVVVSDKGKYLCVISNSFGSINHTYELDVAERSASRPILQFGLPANKTASVGDDVEFKCNVYSDPHPHIQWLKHIEINGSQINPENNSSYVKLLKQSGIDMKNVEILTLRNVTKEDEGEYICNASNFVGYTNHSAFLTISEGSTAWVITM